ncbi:LacI family DNA-binding transcriptional regulator [Granulicella tundricola]|uniref:Transcriptional regulator, LacI family n=1 Tax=Granulicella tundricola (strain ATCC BAA-1859 / DSM 23138 / MP5ACTX9) TaxID=1198114 RepID=E8X6V6_GRATM|nr:LacI family DNA-binding transcriptional regulator [Granulicella tundricola]ADW71256.1 transcriptional regulator, LacI family [Granulicella tundricola MP5ACTX9]
MPKKTAVNLAGGRRVGLKMLAEYLDLSPATVSFVLNNAPGRSIPPATRERVKAAAKKFGYQPSLIARSLQGLTTRTIGILIPELGEGYHSQVLSGAADLLMQEGYFFFTAHHRHKKDLVAEYPQLLRSRGIDGILAIDTHLEAELPAPAVCVAGHTVIPGLTNVVLDHHRAAELALGHLYRLGHRKIAYMHGQPFSSDSKTRWNATLQVARALSLRVSPDLVIRLDKDMSSPELGYPGIHQLLLRRKDFTAVLCFNDVSAIGSIRALHDAGLRVPHDVSVLGFDDIQAAAYVVPSLTTIRQPLHQMGSMAASLLLKKLAHEKIPDVVKLDPELVVRESTAAVRAVVRAARGTGKAGGAG